MFTLNCKGRLLLLDKPIVMGIINATPDSFYSGSRYTGTDAILSVAEKMLNDGASILDIGGQSSRPGSKPVSADEEITRVIRPIEAITKRFPESYISVDTYYSIVAKEAVDAGAVIINDISAGKLDDLMIPVVSSLQVPYVLMHMKGTPQTMQEKLHYENISREILDFFINKVQEIREAGITDIIIDPGFGFGKAIGHNFQLLKNFSLFKMLGFPLLAGLSRKSTIYKTLKISPEDSMNGTTVLNTISLLNGASILRVHDVKEAAEAIKLFDAYQKA
ncbi:MAG TPA: dihydropteroate synthase [Chitinophagaceae bacterium]|nr:dihydropteroate synthase [Chitinophagaceae bacterium]